MLFLKKIFPLEEVFWSLIPSKSKQNAWRIKRQSFGDLKLNDKNQREIKYYTIIS